MNFKRFALAAGIILAASTAATFASAADPIRLCTGKKDGVYDRVGNELKKIAKNTVPIVIVNTTGTIDNMERMIDLPADDPEACDIMLGQPDGKVYLKRTAPNKMSKMKRFGPSLHREYLYALCSKKSGIEDIEKMTSETRMAVGKVGSGTWLVWQNFIAEDSSYADIPTSDAADSDALSALSDGTAACMIVTGGTPTPTILEADANWGDEVVLAEATDKDFNDAVDENGEPLYMWVDIPTRDYPITFNGYWGDVETISWNAAFYRNPDRVPEELVEKLGQAAGRAASMARASFGK